MRKLKLDELEITSFETTAGEGTGRRGTVRANGGTIVPPESRLAPCYPTDPRFDCTYGCSHWTGCPDGCIGA